MSDLATRVGLDELRTYCDFDDEQVYLLMAIARAKENEGTTNNSEPVIREVVETAAELPRKIEQLDHAVSRFDNRFRLYLSANPRDVMAASFELRSRMDEWLKQRLGGDEGVTVKFKRVDSEFKSVLQSKGCKAGTNFIFDLDGTTETEAETLRDRLREYTTVRLDRETPNGYHIVTEPFNYTELDVDVEYELKTDDMIFLAYIGE